MPVSIKDVAREAGVSLGTASTYLNNPERVGPQTARRIRKAIDDLGYVRNEAARQLRAGHSRMLAMLSMELQNPFFGAVAEVIEKRAADFGLFMMLLYGHGDVDRDREYVDLAVQKQVYGMILASGSATPDVLDLLARHRVPTVLMDAHADRDGFASVAIDDVTGARRAVEHLIEQGCRRIAVVGGEPVLPQIQERVLGAQQAAAHRGVRLEVVPTKERTVEAGRAAGEELAQRPARQRPDGIFAINDLVAIGLVDSLVISRGWRIPEQVALVGYDDIDFASSTIVPLSTVRRPRDVFGRVAVDFVRELAGTKTPAPPRHVEIQPELIVRTSSRRR
ncbi:LacI family transcriptional regulator [Kribbella amoyensis]|uniref:LacI family transcriptional regulator n=1 Tax=Kribbella amoyensis TaxID=996641 RepID=A0A561C0M1_9ACTN|nr:LacI family DNA-binding transcriptional regulator [Kribbella amoyensis]TWD84630.1 LacI family transcriptional regulator [Kribbella amoyensis]